MAGHDDEQLIGAWVSPAAARAIEKIAGAHDLSKSSLLRKAVTTYLIAKNEKQS